MPLGTMTVPCLVVIIIADGSVVCSCWASAGVSGICSTLAGAQSWPRQHSFRYQSWARTLPVAAKIVAASSIFGVFITPRSLQKGRRRSAVAFAAPLQFEIAAVFVPDVDCVLCAHADGEADAVGTIDHCWFWAIFQRPSVAEQRWAGPHNLILGSS